MHILLWFTKYQSFPLSIYLLFSLLWWGCLLSVSWLCCLLHLLRFVLTTSVICPASSRLSILLLLFPCLIWPSVAILVCTLLCVSFHLGSPFLSLLRSAHVSTVSSLHTIITFLRRPHPRLITFSTVLSLLSRVWTRALSLDLHFYRKSSPRLVSDGYFCF